MANELTKIPKFRRCVLQNFPFIEQDFDALTDYQLLCKVVEYLNKVITSQNQVIELAESLSIAFNQLQSFVENYFANLDVQEEINNKLDQMAEDGTLQEIITAYIQANVAWAFDTVADMKAATNLVNGSYAQTLGYFALNDGGNGLYKIRTVTNDDVANDATIIALNDETLVAELIFKDEMQVKQFGVYGDGVHDDTLNIQKAIDFIDSKAYALGRSMNRSVLAFAGGRYKTSDTIKLKTSIRLRTDGIATIEYYGDTTAVWIMNDWLDSPNDSFTAREWTVGSLIDGAGLIIRNMTATDGKNATDRGNTIGIEVGIRTAGTDPGDNCVCVYSIKNVRISGFDKGLKINPIYTYVCNYEDVMWLRCNTCIEFGTSGQTVNNGTEKMSFTSCFISDSDVAVMFNVAPVHVDFYNCSLDYINAMFVTSGSFNNPNNIGVFGGHIEGVGDGTESNPSGYKGLVAGYFNRSTLVFNNPLIAINRSPILISDSNILPTTRIIFNDVMMNCAGVTDDQTEPDTAFISNHYVEVNNINCNSYIADYDARSRSILLRDISPYNSLTKENNFNSLSVGSIAIASDTDYGAFKAGTYGNITSAEITNDSPINGKVITYIPTGGNSTLNIISKDIPVEGNEYYKVNAITKGFSARNYKFSFYDEDDNLLYETNESTSNKNIVLNKWYQSPYSKVAQAPMGAKYMKVNTKLISADNSLIETLKVAGIFIEKI